MNSNPNTRLTLATAAWPQATVSRQLILVLAGSWLIALTAQFSLPLWPVPVTGQTLGVLLVAALLGARLGPASLLAYLAQGAVGLPFFAGGSGGPAVLAGLTGGYLAGFVAAAWLVGTLAERGWDRRRARCLLMMLIGTAVIYLFGLPWLARFVGWEMAFAKGVLPFIPGDLLKAMLAALLLPAGWKLLPRAT